MIMVTSGPAMPWVRSMTRMPSKIYVTCASGFLACEAIEPIQTGAHDILKHPACSSTHRGNSKRRCGCVHGNAASIETASALVRSASYLRAGALVMSGAVHTQVHVTADSIDPRYNRPYVDVNELRTGPVPHRYVHGGFSGTGARFSFYFPPADRYEGRFFHNTYPLVSTEDIAPFPIAFEVATGNLGFTIASGAYYVQTNLGGPDRAGHTDPAIGAYRVNAAAAKYSRVIAAELYGDHRPYGYLFGGSGGSYQVVGAAENTSGVWDGFVPFVMGTPNSIPSVFTVRLHPMRVLRLRNKL